MNIFFAKDFTEYKEEIIHTLRNFDTNGIMVGDGNRNVIKIVEINGLLFNFKSFKQHNIINRHVYKFYRKSKARRSFEYAHLLLDKNFYTPKPVAYIENYDAIGLTSSYYISEQLENSVTMADVLYHNVLPGRTEIIKQYTALIYNLHENGIQFIDNTAGNFLIRQENGVYCIYIVDLNRMNFYDQMGIKKRMYNLAKLTPDEEVIHIISEEYASLSELSSAYCFRKIREASNKILIKRRVKKVLKLYKHFIRI